MDEENPKLIKKKKRKEFLISFTGLEKKYLWRRIIFIIFIFFLSAIITHYFDNFLTNTEKKIDIDASISPFIQKGFDGDFLPLIVKNTGDKPLHNVKAAVINCVMYNKNEMGELYFIPETLQPGDQYTVPFGNKDAIQDFERISCSPYSEKPFISVSIPNLTAKNTTTGTLCGYCNYTAYLFSDEINKTINSSYSSPVDITLSLGHSDGSNNKGS